MKRLFPILQLLAIMGLWCPTASGQGSDASKAIIAKLGSFSSAYPTEKTYLQFDKPYYAAGDTIYFKAYITDGGHRLNALSGVLHVDLINTKNKIDQSIKLQIDSGITWGDFALPDTLPGGNYRVRAYTQWMRNDGGTGFFEKIIPVGSIKTAKVPESLAKQPKQAMGLKPDVQFFPEGGSLVAGVCSKVAFKAVGSNGLGVDVKGAIVDEGNKQVASFATSHLGMGYFYLNPGAGKTYKANVTYPNGMQDVIALPKPETSGIVLTVNNDSLPKASVTITANPAFYNENQGKDYTLVIYSGGVITTVNCKLDSPEIKLDILKRKLHTGVATVTLFSPQNEPLCERLIFIQNYDQLDLNVSSAKNTYAKREQVTIKLNAVNRKSDPAEGHFSLAVIDESKVPESEKTGENILSYLLLTSDLKGYIEQPNYYFLDTSSKTLNSLDVLMLTQGYRRFEWKQVLDSAMQRLAYLPEKGIEIAGQVKTPFGKPVTHGTITLIPSKGGPVISSTTDDKGIFRFSNLVFTDTMHFVLSAVNAKNKNTTKISYFNDTAIAPAVVENQQQFSQTVADTAIAALIRNDKLQQGELVKFGHVKGIMLKEVKIKSRKPDDQYYTQSLAGAGHADQVIHGKDLVYGGLLSLRLSSLMRGVHFVYNQRLNKFEPVDNVSLARMEVLIDGAAGELDDVGTDGVETIEVLRPPTSYIYGSDGDNGVIVITTRPRTLRPDEVPAIGVLPIAPMGFYKAREFYSPKYNHVNALIAQQDLRSTIYWNPEIKTDKNGNAAFDYFNGDGTGTYKLIIEGIDKDGNIGRKMYTYRVE